MDSHTITIPNWHPTPVPVLNGKNWRRRAAIRTADADFVAYYANLANVPEATLPRKIILDLYFSPLKIYWPEETYWKSALDALFANRLLVSRGQDWCFPDFATFHLDADVKKTVITLVDLEPPRTPNKSDLKEVKRALKRLTNGDGSYSLVKEPTVLSQVPPAQGSGEHILAATRAQDNPKIAP